MSEWVRCNSCCTKPGKQRFYLTNCGHLFCEECMKDSPETCKLCKSPCKAIMLTSQMKPEVEQYFVDVPTLLNKQVKKLLQVYDFQRTHWKCVASLYEKREATIEKLKNYTAELNKENGLLREENKQLHRLLAEGKGHHTPGIPNIQSPAGISLRRGVTSPSTPYSNSPYGMTGNSTPHQEGMMQRQPQVRTPTGPSRFTVRTPPSNGVIGGSRRSPYNSQRPGSAGNTPGGLSQRLASASSNTPVGMRTASTPGGQDPVTPSMLTASIPQNTFSPMNTGSPAMMSSQNRANSWVHSQVSSSQRTPGSSLSSYEQRDSSSPLTSSSQISESGSQSSNLDPSRAPIQLRYGPRINAFNRPPYITTPARSTHH